MWSENSCGHLCIQVFGKTVLIGSDSDSTPLPSLCVYRKEMIQGSAHTFASRVLIQSWCIAAFPTRLQNPFRTLPTNIFYFLDYFSPLPSVFSKSLIFSQPSTIWNTYCFWLLALMKYFGCVLLNLFYLGESMLLATAILHACMIRMLHLFS